MIRRRPIMKSPIAATAAVLLLLGCLVNAQRGRVASEQEQWILGEYWTVVKDYQKGRTAESITEMSNWTHDRIATVQATQFQPESALTDLLLSKTEWKPAVLRHAAMLHTEIALNALRRQGDFSGFQFHTGIADGWLRLADQKASSAGGLRSRWNVAVARVFLLNKEVIAAEAYLDRVSTQFPNDAEVLLAFATAKESRAARLGAEATRERDDLRAAAVSLFERALTLDAGLMEARLRLARLALDRDEVTAAEPLLTSVKASPDPDHRYLAALWLGQIRERQKPWTAAAELYVEAIKTRPDAESAYQALANVLRANGDDAQAAAVMDRFRARGVRSLIADPAITYALGLETALEARFEALIAEVKAAKPPALAR